jgi:hypothetical protein
MNLEGRLDTVMSANSRVSGIAYSRLFDKVDNKLEERLEIL